MAKFHISKKGNPEQCHAMNGNCPLSSNDEHYDSKEAAYVGLSESEKTVPEPAKRNHNDDGLYGGYSSSESKDLVSKGAVWKSNSSGYKLPNGSFIGVFYYPGKGYSYSAYKQNENYSSKMNAPRFPSIKKAAEYLDFK